MDKSKWEEEAASTCLPGIHARFYQNPNAMDTLLYKTGMKRIVECASDRLWGTGIPLGDPVCLDLTKWISQGILGQILECICSEVTQPRRQFYHQPPPSTFPNVADQLPHQPIPNMGPKTNPATCASGANVSMPVPCATSTTTTTDDLVTTDISTSASTIPVSDTTASDMDPSDSQSHHSSAQLESAPMEDTPSSLNTI